MFDKKYEDRLGLWSEFRKTLETSANPFEDILSFYDRAPAVTIQADPWDQNTWPDPWKLLEENCYCSFVKILAMCYTLQLTKRFSQCQFEIHITQDKENIRYLLTVDDVCIGYDLNRIVSKNILKKTKIEQTYVMPYLQ